MTSTTIIYGFHAIRNHLNKAAHSVESVTLLHSRRDKSTQQLVAMTKGRGVTLHNLNAEYFQQALQKHNLAHAVHQGVFACIHSSNRITFLEQLWPRLGANALLLLLDGVTDPHNLGACMRVANATAVDALIVPKDNSAPLNATAIKAACGTSEGLPYITVTNFSQALKQLKLQGFCVYGTADDADATLYDCPLPKRIALVMGSEGKGIRQLTRRHCDHILRIPMLGDIESLNVSVASAISLYDIRRRQNAF